jgi:hypothetical protein
MSFNAVEEFVAFIANVASLLPWENSWRIFPVPTEAEIPQMTDGISIFVVASSDGDYFCSRMKYGSWLTRYGKILSQYKENPIHDADCQPAALFFS